MTERRRYRDRTDGLTLSVRALAGRKRSKTIALTQNDIRAVQLARPACRCGIHLLDGLAARTGSTRSRLWRVRRPHRPASGDGPGFVPDGRVETVRSVGNAAGTGTWSALESCCSS